MPVFIGHKVYTNKDRILLYEQYCVELELYDEEEIDYTSDTAQKVAEVYLKQPCFEWIDIFYCGILVGFLIIGRNLDIHGNGFYICEAFVLPRYRRKGLMTAAVKKALDGYHGMVYYEVFRRNLIALAFWRSIFTENRAEFIAERETENNECLHEFVVNLFQ